MLAEHARLEKEISTLQSKLKSFPDGKLFCVHNGNHFKWFYSDGHTKTYIPKKQREYAEQLAIKKYLMNWEHFGLMDDESYSQNTSSKLQLYTSCGIIPGIQLITTYETKEYPLSTEVIEKTIHYYFG